MRQIREEVARNHVGKTEQNSFTKHAFATLIVVYGGEAMTGAYCYSLRSNFWLLTRHNMLQRHGWARRLPSSWTRLSHCYTLEHRLLLSIFHGLRL